MAWVRENSSEAKVISTKEPPSHDNNLLEGTEKNKPNEPFEIQRGIGSNISFGSPEPLSHGISYYSFVASHSDILLFIFLLMDGIFVILHYTAMFF